MDEQNLQTLVEYYRSKCSQLEYDFVQYQIAAEAAVAELRARVEELEPTAEPATEPTTKSK